MPSPPAYADLELHFVADAPHSYKVDARFRLALSSVDAHLTTGAAPRVVIDQAALNEVWPDVDAYGQRLAGMLFADQGLKDAFAKARDQAEGARQPLRVCLRLDLNDATLHAIRWETLHDPAGGGRLFTSERVILSRYIDSPDTSPIDPHTARQLKALVVVAAPTDLVEKFRLAPIDVVGEVNRAQTALRPLPMTVLTRDETQAPVTLAAIGQALRAGVDLLYLVAHGQLHKGKPYLCLENQDGTAVWVDGDELVQQVAQLARRPLLIILASCQSAGRGQDDGVLAALGPRLAGHGVAAVIAMQGNVGMSTIAQLMLALLRRLRDTGQVDLAFAAARAAVLHQPDWWMPVLFLRVRSGQILEQPYIPGRNLPGPFRGAVARMVEDYEAIFGGRESELAVLDAWLEKDTRPYAFLHAPTGRGKTALLIHWVARVQQRGDWSVIFVPVSLRYQTATAESVLGALATALADFHGEREQIKTYSTSPDQLRPLIADYLRRPSEDNRRLLVVLDGLDEAIGWHIGREIFPRDPGPHIRIVASARQQAQMSRTDWYEQLGWRTDQTTDLELAGLRREAVSDILRRMGNPLDHLATDVDLLSEIARISEGDPLTIRYLVEALQDGTLEPGKLLGLTPGLEAYLRAWLDELGQHSSQSDTIYTLLSLCAVALGPLTEQDLRRLAPEEFRRRDKLTQAVKQVGRFIIGDGSEEGGYVFSHPRLREVFLERLLSEEERQEISERFIADGQRLYDERVRPLPAYVRQSWITHLTEAHKWSLIQRVLTEVVKRDEHFEQPWAAVRFAAEGSYAGYLADLNMFWEYADQCSDIATSVICALIVASIRSLSGNLFPELLAGLVTVGTLQGRWSMAAALEHIQQMPDPRRQAAAIKMLITIEAPISYRQALEVASSIADEGFRAEALRAIALHLPTELLPVAFNTICAIISERYRIETLTAFASRLLVADQPIVFQTALDIARTFEFAGNQAEALTAFAPHLPTKFLSVAFDIASVIIDEQYRAQSLAALASHLPAELLPAAFDIARAITSERPRAEVLAALASHLPAELLPAAFDIARAITSERPRAEVLAALAKRLPTADQAVAFKASLDIVGSLTHADDKAEALVALSPYLLAAARRSVWKTAFNIALDINSVQSRAKALAALAPRLQAADQPAVFQAALEIARAVRYANVQADTLSTLAHYLPSTARLKIWKTTLDAIRNEPGQEKLLALLVPHLPADLLSAAFDIARAIAEERYRVDALMTLAPHLPTKLLPAALDITRAFNSERNRAEVLGALAPRLVEELLPIALDITRAFNSERNRAEVLGALAPRLVEELLPIAFDMAHAFTNEGYRAETLTVLAPRLQAADQPAVFQAVLNLSNAINDEQDQVGALTAFTPHLHTADQPAVFHVILDAIRSIRVEKAQVSALAALVPHLPAKLLSAAFDIARTIMEERYRADALVALAPHLSTDLLFASFDIAQVFVYAGNRAEALTALAPYLPLVDQSAVFLDILDSARTFAHERNRADALAALAPYLSTELLSAAFNIACSIAEERYRRDALVALAPYLSTELLPVAFTVARAITDEQYRAGALAALAPRLPAGLLPIALDAARAIAGEQYRAEALTALAPCLPAGLLPIALDAARAIAGEQYRAKALTALAPCLPIADQPAVFQAALDAASAIADEQYRAETLTALASCLPITYQPAVLQAALDAACAIKAEGGRAGVLAILATHLSTELLPAALNIACDIAHKDYRANTLRALASRHAVQRIPAYMCLPIFRALATHGRSRLLSDLDALTPWLVTLTTEDERVRIAQAIIAVCRCWP